jgi:3-methyl-2-oxobutanoate hydroxymethyltransferase
MAHCGLRPQNIRQLGGYRVQRDERQLLNDAQAAEHAGAFAIVLECIPAEAASRITASLTIPTIGIGAGAGCDGQILVLNDLLGLNPGHVPRHVKAYAHLKETVVEAVARYRDEVREGKFPGEENAFV